MRFTERTYRNKVLNHSLISYQVKVRETDLFISSDSDFRQAARQSVHRYRGYLESYIKSHPDFLTSLVPLKIDDLAPDIVRDMMKVTQAAGVGPMAAVAGALAEYVGQDLLKLTPNVIVENGGDIFLKSKDEISIGIFAGDSSLSDKLALKIRPEEMPMGICTSSATVGPSLSFGIADAVCVKSKSAAMADAAATMIGNLVKTKKDIKKAISCGSQIKDVLGILIIVENEMGLWGKMELI
jgi:ApbE superfamily uncharacterized protein (UPF0280 family)